MARTVRELIADGLRNEAAYLKRRADERLNEAFRAARLAETWAKAEREGWPFFYDYQNRRMWHRAAAGRTEAGG